MRKKKDDRHIRDAGTVLPRERRDLSVLSILDTLIHDIDACEIINLGWGTSDLSSGLEAWGYSVFECNPFGESDCADAKRDFDMAVCAGALERVHESDVGNFLEKIKLHSDNAVFIISKTFSDEILLDGSNAHRTIKPTEWWASSLREIFGYVEEVELPEATKCCFATWELGENANLEIKEILKGERRMRAMKRRLLKPLRRIGSHLAPFVRRKDVFDALKGKSIAVVGNATSLKEQDFGAEIDSHDIVLRMNRAPILSEQSHGARTDWIATSLEISPELVSARDVSLVLWMTPKSDKFPFWMILNCRQVYRHRKDLWRDLRSRLPRRPSTGAMVLDLLRRSEAAKISVYGFDKGASGSISNAGKACLAPHDFVAEWNILEEWSHQDDRVRIVIGE